jgi:hypothetical protein
MTAQHERILAHLQIFGTITNAQAHTEYGIRHLPSAIRNIKKFHPEITIIDHWEEGKNRFNEKCRWKVYEIKTA